MLNLNIQNEYNKLKKVYISNRGGPDHDIQGFVRDLKNHGVDVLLGGKTKFTQLQWPFLRDPFMVIDDTFMLAGIDSSGQISTRPDDLLTACWDIMNLIDDNKFNSDAILNQQHGIPTMFEGGDVIVHNKKLYVGQGGATNRYGRELLKKNFSNKFDVIPIHTAPNVIHLDCAFNPLSADVALAHLDSIHPISREVLKKDFKILEITGQEQKALACNVFSIGDNHVFVEKQQERVINMLKKNSFKPIPTKFDMPIKIGGSFRCATCPLERE